MTVRHIERSVLSSAPQIWVSSSDASFTAQGDCDCACPSMFAPDNISSLSGTLIRSIPKAKLQNLQLTKESIVHDLAGHTIVLSSYLDKAVVLDIEGARFLSYFGTSREFWAVRNKFPQYSDDVLTDLVTILLKTGVLYSLKDSRQLPVSALPTVQTAWLHLTNACNLDCGYCYVPRNKDQISIERIEEAIESIFRSAIEHRFSQVYLKYAGGEPTSNFKALEAAQTRAEEFSSATGIAIRSILLTNGTSLSSSNIEFLGKHRVQVSLSMDGVGTYHNVQRPRKSDSRGSFGDAAEKLTLLKKYGLSPHVSITVSALNIAGLADLFDYLLDHDVSFSLNFFRDVDRSHVNTTELAFSSEIMIQGLRKAFKVIEKRPPKWSLLSALTDRANLSFPHARTCGVGQSYMVIDTKGQIAKCHMDIDKPITTIDATDPLSELRTDTARLQNLHVDAKECSDCMWRYRCAGGCPRLTFMRTGRYNAKSPLCDIYQFLLPEVLRLEALRIMKHESPWQYSIQ